MKLKIAFYISLFFALFASAIFPSIRLFAFAPFITLTFLQKNLYTSLWYSLGCGLIADLVQNQYLFGIYALCYSLSTLILYRQKWFFFADKPFSLPLFVAIYSAIATFVLTLILSLASVGGAQSLFNTFFDALLMIILDSAYAFCCFTLPVIAYKLLKKKILLMKAAKEE